MHIASNLCAPKDSILLYFALYSEPQVEKQYNRGCLYCCNRNSEQIEVWGSDVNKFLPNCTASPTPHRIQYFSMSVKLKLSLCSAYGGVDV
jgi:hypothetical protein